MPTENKGVLSAYFGLKKALDIYLKLSVAIYIAQTLEYHLILKQRMTEPKFGNFGFCAF